MIAPPPPIQFLDIGKKIGLYEVEGPIPDWKDRSNVPIVPVPGAFYGVMREKLGKAWTGDRSWCDPNAWVKRSPSHDFHVIDPLGYTWGLPIIVPTCPRKLFEQGPRKKYVDIATDTLHASSSDLITWNTLSHGQIGVAGVHPNNLA